MVILLDIDGVMLPEQFEDTQILSDGFRDFTPIAIASLNRIIAQTNVSIVLSSNHRVSFSAEQWVNIFNSRSIAIQAISILNDRPFNKMMDRATEIKEWVEIHGADKNYVIIDDDYSLNTLPSHIKQRCILTNPAIGLNDEAADRALGILLNNTDISQL